MAEKVVRWWGDGGSKLSPEHVSMSVLFDHLEKEGGEEGKLAAKQLRDLEAKGVKLQLVSYGATPRLTADISALRRK